MEHPQESPEGLFEKVLEDYRTIVESVRRFSVSLEEAQNYREFSLVRTGALRFLESTYRDALEGAMDQSTDILTRMQVFAFYHDQIHQPIKALRMVTIVIMEDQWEPGCFSPPEFSILSGSDVRRTFDDTRKVYKTTGQVQWMMMDIPVQVCSRVGIDWKTVGDDVNSPLALKFLNLADVSLVTRYPEELRALRIPCAGLVAQMAAGIAANAWQVLHTRPSADPKDVIITLAHAQKEQHVTITVEDTGTGFPDGVLRKLQKGRQVGSSTGGSGLWLTMCERTVREQLHGTLTMGNRRQGGARVILTLPSTSGATRSGRSRGRRGS